MSKIQLFIAATLDGFIARDNGSLDWLLEMENPNQIDHGYNDFISNVDIIIMGRKTYDVLLGFGIEWPYSHCKTYITTNKVDYEIKTENTFILKEITKQKIEILKSESKMNIWLVGGGNLITQFINIGAIDEITLSVIPIILGKGIKLFANDPLETKLKLIKSEAFETGVVNLVYQKKEQ
ncbi:MAG TPA: dihydrofolate reductase [Bacteroidales bacterium]|nr:dihydrofolate reductase [Bacteroidales bacterium]